MPEKNKSSRDSTLIMRKNIILTLLLAVLHATAAQADNWEWIVSCGEYYYGMGVGRNESEATSIALNEMNNMIAVNVESRFNERIEETDANGETNHKTWVESCVKSYSASTMRNVHKMEPINQGGEITVRVYMKRSEMEKVYAERIAQAKALVASAEENLQELRLDNALQFYYWAYAMIRTLEHPSEALDERGQPLLYTLPQKIRDVLGGVKVSYNRRDDDRVQLLFTYQGKPVSSLMFNYHDGEGRCFGSAVRDGYGIMEMIPGSSSDSYDIDIEYEYKEMTMGDVVLDGVLAATGRKPFPSAQRKVWAQQTPDSEVALKAIEDNSGLKPADAQQPADAQPYVKVMEQVVEAIRTRNFLTVVNHFTSNGQFRYNQLIKYGNGRVIGTPSISFFNSHDGHVVARGLKMSFAFKRGTKTTFVEDVVFTFDRDCRIDNVTFGLGQQASDDMLCKHPSWKNETREMLTEFLENYKTAYCLKDSVYIRNVFADDATIIVGHVAWRKAKPNMADTDRSMSMGGKQVITENRYTKDQYLRNLRRCFDRNEFINIHFTHSDIQWLEKHKDKELFGIQLGQEYNSSTYADKGFLFLLVDMTDHEAPQIKVRTWQPNEIDIDKVYHAGYFYDK